MEQKLYDAASKLPEPGLSFDSLQPEAENAPNKKIWRRLVSWAACFALLIAVGYGSYVYYAEAEEYREAVEFFDEYGLSTDGLSRGEIKAVYRDITTKSFSYSKTAEVIESSLLRSKVGGYEIIQEQPLPEEVESLWNYMNAGKIIREKQEGSRYEYRSEYKKDPELGFKIHDKSYIEKYDGDTLVWSVAFSEFRIDEYCVISDGIMVYGATDTWSSLQTSYGWVAKIDEQGNLKWKDRLDHGFEDEYIAAALENPDGTYDVISRGDLEYFCLTRYSSDGRELHFKKTAVGNRGIWNVVRFGEGYLVQLGSYRTDEYARIVKVDQEGNITDSFSYSDEDSYYYITDMIEFDGKIYLSGYSVPKPEDESRSAGGRYEIAPVLNYLFDHNIWEISSEELTPMVRENYTAMLMVCDPKEGTPWEFYSVKGSLGGKLSLSDSGMLLWDVESISNTFYSPATSSFTIGGTSYVFRYSFDKAGNLISQEKTGETVPYRR